MGSVWSQRFGFSQGRAARHSAPTSQPRPACPAQRNRARRTCAMMPATPSMAQRQCTRSDSANHLRRSGSAPRPKGSKPAGSSSGTAGTACWARSTGSLLACKATQGGQRVVGAARQCLQDASWLTRERGQKVQDTKSCMRDEQRGLGGHRELAVRATQQCLQRSAPSTHRSRRAACSPPGARGSRCRAASWSGRRRSPPRRSGRRGRSGPWPPATTGRAAARGGRGSSATGRRSACLPG